MLHRFCLSVIFLVLAGCSDSTPSAIPAIPVPAGVVLPAGMPNDNWFYETVVQSPVPVLVDFTATWCPPCQAMKPAIHQIETDYGSRLKVVEVDHDERPNLYRHFRVRGIPHLMVIQKGVIQAEAGGQQTYAELVTLLKPTVSPP
jgi:thioredoxin 1